MPGGASEADAEPAHVDRVPCRVRPVGDEAHHELGGSGGGKVVRELRRVAGGDLEIADPHVVHAHAAAPFEAVPRILPGGELETEAAFAAVA